MTAAPAAPELGAVAQTRAGESSLTGTRHLTLFILRRDRVRLSVWTASMVLSYDCFTAALETAFAAEAGRQGRAAVMQTPAGSSWVVLVMG